MADMIYLNDHLSSNITAYTPAELTSMFNSFISDLTSKLGFYFAGYSRHHREGNKVFVRHDDGGLLMYAALFGEKAVPARIGEFQLMFVPVETSGRPVESRFSDMLSKAGYELWENSIGIIIPGQPAPDENDDKIVKDIMPSSAIKILDLYPARQHPKFRIGLGSLEAVKGNISYLIELYNASRSGENLDELICRSPMKEEQDKTTTLHQA